jgi:hypothetical protein
VGFRGVWRTHPCSFNKRVVLSCFIQSGSGCGCEWFENSAEQGCFRGVWFKGRIAGLEP